MNKTDRLKALFAVVTLLAVTAVTNGQTRRQQPATATVVPTSIRNDKLAAAYHSGQLPEPLRKPEGTEDQVAAALAKRVAAGDDQQHWRVTAAWQHRIDPFDCGYAAGCAARLCLAVNLNFKNRAMPLVRALP